MRNRRLVAASALGLLLTAVTLAVASLLIGNEQHKTRETLDMAIAQRNEAKRAQE